MRNILIAGVGGQGTVLASKLIAAAAMKNGLDVRTTETIGMAQRGGSVVSHVRMGENIYSPLIPLGKADALIAFEPAEAARQLPFLSAQGSLLVCDTPIKSNKEELISYLKNSVSKLTALDGASLTNGQTGAKTINVCLLGAAAQAGLFPFGAESVIEAIREILPERFIEMNIEAFEKGRSLI